MKTFIGGFLLLVVGLQLCNALPTDAPTDAAAPTGPPPPPPEGTNPDDLVNVDDVDEDGALIETRWFFCSDNRHYCYWWARQGHCHSYYYAHFMKRHCRRSCGFCGW